MFRCFKNFDFDKDDKYGLNCWFKLCIASKITKGKAGQYKIKQQTMRQEIRKINYRKIKP